MAAGAPVLPRAAIAYLRSKGIRPSRHWLSVWREEHASAFTVAQMTRQDMLEQVHREVRRALRSGETLESFRARLEPWLREKGWTPRGRGGSLPRRLQRIYHTNLRSAHAAGQWGRIQRTKEALPFLLYTLGPSEEHRPDHAAWAGLCLRADDPWWSTHMPPNGWGCKCRVRQVARPPEGARTRAPALDMQEWTNPATGEIVPVPRGIDPGWDYNPAEHAGLGAAQALTGRLERLAAPAASRQVQALSARVVRERLAGATAAASRRLAEREEDLRRAGGSVLIGPGEPGRPAASHEEYRARFDAEMAVWKAEDALGDQGRDMVLRTRPTAFRDGAEPAWESAAAEEKWSPAMTVWRRLVAPDLVRRTKAPRVIEVQRDPQAPLKIYGSADYVRGVVRIRLDARRWTMAHELSHLLEADARIFRAAVAFLSRRTAGDAIDTVHKAGALGRRDKFRDWTGKRGGDDFHYPGAIYEADRFSDEDGWHRARLAGLPGAPPARKKGDRGDVDVRATEVLSMGVEWLLTDPARFAIADPDYFDFIWDTVVRGR